MTSALVLSLLATVLPAQQPVITNSIGMELVLIAPGTMVVGRFQPQCPPPNANERVSESPARWTADDHARCADMVKRDALPGFTVRIDRPYYIGKYEVTQGEWKRVMGTNPSTFKDGADADRRPVDNITFTDAQAFVRKLSAREPGTRYRLPTEFEWEYAARAGDAGEPSWDAIRESAWQGDVDLGTTHAVGGKKSNGWGLHDTLGNVWEWVADVYNERLFADSVTTRAGKTHVLKGGSFVSDVKNATWSTHAGGPGSGFDTGFRIVREAR